jgi:NAD(P)-dependent dehydrogenase (short-subunit alcohol dehydrogenase family)
MIMPYYLPLAEQVVLITGAAGGIGRAISYQLAQQYPGIRLVLTDCQQELLEQSALSCRQAGAEVVAILADLTNSEQLEALPKVALDKFGQVNSLINNAGYSQSGPVESISLNAVEQHFRVNLFAAIALIQALTPVMRCSGGGRIINITSIAGRIAFPFEGVYGASKFALEGLSDALRMELAPFNIQVIVIAPGAVLTNALEVGPKALIELLSDFQNTPYSAATQQVSKLAQQIKQHAWSAEQVAKVIHQALSDRDPKPRYVAATAINKLMLALMLRVLPTKVTDRFRQQLYGINLVAEDWQHRSNKNRVS